MKEPLLYVLVHQNNTHTTGNCNVYNRKTPGEKVELLRANQACLSFLKVEHRSTDFRCRRKCNEESYNKYHLEPHS